MSIYLQLDWLTVIFITITILWWAEFRFLNSPQKSEIRGGKSYKLIIASIFISVLLTIIFTYFSVATLPLGLAEPARIIGLIFYLLGIILRYWSSYLLGQTFSRGVKEDTTQKLVDTGPYRIIRHPLYLGLLLLTIAIPIYFGNLLALLITLILMIWSVRRRIKEEEDEFLHLLGERYQQWMKDRYKLIPFIY